MLADHRLEVAGTLLGALDVDGGPTDEQARLLGAVCEHLLGLTGPLERVEHLSPEAAAAALPGEALRHAVVEGLVVLELVRHPASEALAEQVERYARALGVDEGMQALARDYVARDCARIAEDFARLRAPSPEEQEAVDRPAEEVTGLFAALAECPPGSLGAEFVAFHRRHGFPMPDGADDHLAVHDFCHVLAGYEADAVEEVALQAMLTAAAGGRNHFTGLMASLSLYEVGMLPFPGITPKTGVLDRPGAIETFAAALEQGARCGVDLATLDHLALAERPLAELRDELGIVAR